MSSVMGEASIVTTSSFAAPTSLANPSHDGLSLDVSSVWMKSIHLIQSRLDPQIFAAWIKPLAISRLNVLDGVPSSTEVELVAPNKLCCEHVERMYGRLISSALEAAVGLKNVQLRFRVDRLRAPAEKPADGVASETPKSRRVDTKSVETKTAETKTKAASQKTRATRLLGESNLNPKYNFSNFVVGGCNQFAHAVGLRVSQHLGTAYNPLFIYGGVGLGKTHLVNAIGNSAHRSGKNVLVVSSEVFVNEVIAAIRGNKMQQFKNKFRSLDVLIIDDIQFLIGKERTQEEFFHTFNDLHHRHRQIVITSDKTPQELVGLEERLRTRFASGLSVDLQAPDFETRVAILCKKADAGGFNLPESVARLLAEKIDTNVRELEGALNRLLAHSSVHNTPITPEFAHEALRTLIPEKAPREITFDLIQRSVAERYSVSTGDLLGKRRTQNIAFARHVAMYLCRRMTGRSFPEIGALFGGRDHSTVIHATRVVQERIKSDPNLIGDLETLERNLRG